MGASVDDIVSGPVPAAPLWPSAIGVAGASAVGYVAMVDPSVGGVQVACPFHAVTGWWCPGCGLTRATHHLLHGDVSAALSYHALVPVVLALGVWAWLAWWWPSVSGRSLVAPWRLPVPVWITTAGALLAFAVLRNAGVVAAPAP